MKKRQKGAKQSKQEESKGKLNEIKAEEKSLHGKLEQLKAEQTAAHKAMKKAISYVEEGGQRINYELKVNDMVNVQARNKLIELRRQCSLEQI